MLKIDQFYQDENLGRLKFKGYSEGRLLFDQYQKVFGDWHPAKVTLDPVLNKTRISNLKESNPPV